jgi:hypothetical protein
MQINKKLNICDLVLHNELTLMNEMEYRIVDLNTIFPAEIVAHIFAFLPMWVIVFLSKDARNYAFTQLEAVEKKCDLTPSNKNIIMYYCDGKEILEKIKELYRLNPTIFPLFIAKYKLKISFACSIPGNLAMFKKHYNDYYSNWYILHAIQLAHGEILACVFEQAYVTGNIYAICHFICKNMWDHMDFIMQSINTHLPSYVAFCAYREMLNTFTGLGVRSPKCLADWLIINKI